MLDQGLVIPLSTPGDGGIIDSLLSRRTYVLQIAKLYHIKGSHLIKDFRKRSRHPLHCGSQNLRDFWSRVGDLFR